MPEINIKDCQSVHSDYNVIPTGLWVSDETPELACSPDGVIKDPRLSDHEPGIYGLPEIKCPVMLKKKILSILNGCSQKNSSHTVV